MHNCDSCVFCLFEVGVVLKSTEVKAVRECLNSIEAGHACFKDTTRLPLFTSGFTPVFVCFGGVDLLCMIPTMPGALWLHHAPV